MPNTTLTYTPRPNTFEKDTHLAVAGAEVASVHIIYGETEREDVTAVVYKGVPAMSFYDVYGRLVDVDHYLPDDYLLHDQKGAESVLENLRIKERELLTDVNYFPVLVGEVFSEGQEDLAVGLQKVYGLEGGGSTERLYLEKLGAPPDRARETVLSRFEHMRAFLLDYIATQLETSNNYVHFTPANNIVITPLNKRSGVAVMIETRDERGNPLRPSSWRITRTHSVPQLEKALVFRTDDIQYFFDPDTGKPELLTDRYSMQVYPNRLVLDSLLDETTNLLSVPLHHACFQVLASDPDVIIALSEPRKVSIVNTHRSVVPGKWLDTITLPEEAQWVRADENLSVLFCLTASGSIAAYNVTGEQPEPLDGYDGGFTMPFTLDREGALTLVQSKGGGLAKVATNANDIHLPGQDATFATVFQNLSHLFRGESLFTKATYARVIEEGAVEQDDRLPTAIEVARFDFETNVDHLLAEAGENYEDLLEIRQKLAIARQNIQEEFTEFAEREGIRLVGKRMQQTIHNIVRPTERRIVGLVEKHRARQLLEQARGYQAQLSGVSAPGAYRNVLNDIRRAGEELGRMAPENTGNLLTEFRTIQADLNALFSRQIAEDGNALQTFILGEIEQIEEAIEHSYEPRRLESLLNTHPAALELMNLLKQPFVLQSVAQEQQLSPAGIQARLHGAVDKRLDVLREEADRREAERNAAKLQLAGMVREEITFFIEHHSGGFSDLELSNTAPYQTILNDVNKLERVYGDTRLANELRARLERVILDRNRKDLEHAVSHEGKYAFVQNDADLYVDLQSTVRTFPQWSLELIEKPGATDRYQATFVRNTDREVYRPSTTENLRSGRSFEIDSAGVADYLGAYERYAAPEHKLELLQALWNINRGENRPADFPQYQAALLKQLAPADETTRRALGAAKEKKHRDRLERTRERNVPAISPEFIDETPYFQAKLREFFIKAKLQLGTGAGVLLLSGPPSTGKSAFLKFAAALMNREYFEHASDKWQTKNSLVTAIRFGETGPYTTPAGFTRAITTAHSLINIEEIKEWPEALRKSLNPFFAGSKSFIAPDGTSYRIGDNILLCAAANLGSMYRMEDEAFTADFWSRIEVVEYDYAPHKIDQDYFDQLHEPLRHSYLTMRDLVRTEFNIKHTAGDPDRRARTISRSLVSFLILPKADDKVKRDRLRQEINNFFEQSEPTTGIYGPEEAAKVALRRIKDLQSYSATQFFDLYDHFINGRPFRDPSFQQLQITDTARYEHLRVVFLTLWYLEGCLRHIREVFRRTGGQTEIEGTNREFINSVYLLGLMGKLES